MKIKLKRVLISTATSIYLLSFSGCLDDRAFLGTRTNIAETGIDTGIDSDGDGLSNKQEEKLGTNPNNSDSDGDGVNDGVEVGINDDGSYKIDNPANTNHDDSPDVIDALDPKNDSDNDGLTNAEEKKYGTKPLEADSDSDGLLDGEEVNILNTNPINKDSDNDGVEDGIEVGFDGEGENKVYHVNNPANTNHDDDPDLIDALDPLNDSDGDKRPNLYEIDSQKRKDAGYLVDFNETTDPLDESDYYPWITEVEPGKTMIDNGFVYIPGGFDVDDDGDDESGFWMAQYEARANGATTITIDNLSNFIKENFISINTTDILVYKSSAPGLSGEPLYTPIYSQNGTEAMTGMYGYEAAALIAQNQIDRGLKTTLPSNKQYSHVVAILNNNNEVQNSYDVNVPASYKGEIFEIDSGILEFTKNLVKLSDFDEQNPPSWWRVEKVFYNDSDKAAASTNTLINEDSGAGKEQDPFAVILEGDKDSSGKFMVDLTYGVTFGEKGKIGFRAASDYLK